MQLLLTGAYSYSDEQFQELKGMGFEVFFVQDERIPLHEQDLCFEVADIDAVVCNGLFLHNSIDIFKNLKFIQLTSAGLDRVPLDKIRARGIELRNARGVYSIPMAEYAVCGVLQLLKHARRFSQAQCAHEWRKDRTLGELHGRQILVLGCGSVGTECAKRFNAFGCDVVGVDLCPRQDDQNYVRMVGLDSLDEELANADVIVVTVPLTDETRNMIDARRLALCKQGCIVVNIARGGIIDEPALEQSLESGRVTGAILDVFQNEPLAPESPLWGHDNVIITPHNSFVGEGNKSRLWNIIESNCRKFLRSSNG